MIIIKIKKSVQLSKAGNPYAKVIVQFEEHKDGKGNMQWIGGFGNKRTWAWKVGDDVAPEITQEGKYLNFSFDDTEENKLDVYQLNANVAFVMDLLKTNHITRSGGSAGSVSPSPKSTPTGNGTPASNDIAPEDIPF